MIPCVPAQKQQADTISTLAGLLKMGVPQEKIRVVFNQVESGDDLTRTFQAVLLFAKQEGLTSIKPGCMIASNEIFQILKATDNSITDLAADRTDYKALIATAADQSEKVALAKSLATRRLASGILPDLQACFEELDLK